MGGNLLMHVLSVYHLIVGIRIIYTFRRLRISAASHPYECKMCYPMVCQLLTFR